jgi:hypothetical protein
MKVQVAVQAITKRLPEAKEETERESRSFRS